MTGSVRPAAIPRSHSRLIRNPGAGPRIEVQLSLADSRHSGKSACVAVRCGQCDQRLYDVAIGQYFLGEDFGWVEDGTLVVTRKCPKCRGLNQGRVTALVGQPSESSDALGGPWRCTHCGWSLGKIHPIRGRITTTCRCGHETRKVAAESIKAVYPFTR
jgi:hypothetical protein